MVAHRTMRMLHVHSRERCICPTFAHLVFLFVEVQRYLMYYLRDVSKIIAEMRLDCMIESFSFLQLGQGSVSRFSSFRQLGKGCR